jgi:hypothetical protein
MKIRFPAAGTIVASVALIVALSGTAVAADLHHQRRGRVRRHEEHRQPEEHLLITAA